MVGACGAQIRSGSPLSLSYFCDAWFTGAQQMLFPMHGGKNKLILARSFKNVLCIWKGGNPPEIENYLGPQQSQLYVLWLNGTAGRNKLNNYLAKSPRHLVCFPLMISMSSSMGIWDKLLTVEKRSLWWHDEGCWPLSEDPSEVM